MSDSFQTVIRRNGDDIVIEKDGRADAIKAWNSRCNGNN